LVAPEMATHHLFLVPSFQYIIIYHLTISIMQATESHYIALTSKDSQYNVSDTVLLVLTAAYFRSLKSHPSNYTQNIVRRNPIRCVKVSKSEMFLQLSLDR
jgi:hypothetical protein